MPPEMPPEDAALFARLCGEVGRDPEAYRRVRVWRKEDARRSHVVERFDGPGGGVVLKRIFRPADATGFRRVVGAQRRAAAAMDGAAGVPRVLAVDEGQQAVLMEAVAGETCLAMLETGADPAQVLRAAGGWMAAFHRAGPVETRVFQPRFMRDHLTHLLAELEAGVITVPHRKAFERAARAAIDLAPEFEGRETRSSWTHGDLNLHNIVLDGPRSYGLDFTADHTAPVGFDIARLLINFAGRYVPVKALGPGELLPAPLLGAFFEGYDLVGPEDPSVGYLLRVRLLMDWASIPARLTQRSLGKTLRLEHLRRLARHALA
ncbi:phosphotransferase [Poseidonocella sedimentorum]|uniref:Phosphotransferase enzyme family protein n=1 Tax=Poseidonocella sedimentorum TaxID=871652 RepID=A0A1I6D6S6_9RHOB|nr:phosphotransferase [Poseidonocella sedimentorum]SFR01159.1 Phosphotransferase enzyme family protein [Poseidonocella sedimentorum]